MRVSAAQISASLESAVSPPIAAVFLRGGIAHAYADFIAFVAHDGRSRSDVFHIAACGRLSGGRLGCGGLGSLLSRLFGVGGRFIGGNLVGICLVRHLRGGYADGQLAAEACGGLTELIDQLAVDGVSADIQRRAVFI